MDKEKITAAIESGEIHSKDIFDNSAFIVFGENEAHYIKKEGIWCLEDNIYGNLAEALGGEEAENLALELLGLVDTQN